MLNSSRQFFSTGICTCRLLLENFNFRLVDTMDLQEQERVLDRLSGMQSIYRAFFLFVLLILAARAHAYTFGPLNTASLLEQAPLACRVKVLSVRPIEIAGGRAGIYTGAPLVNGVAVVEVSRVLKGTCPQQLRIAIPVSNEEKESTRLHVGEWAIVFLAPLSSEVAAGSVVAPEVREATDYVSYSAINGILKIPAPTNPVPVVETEKDSQRRLLDELIQAAENKRISLALFQRAIEQLGVWAVERDRRIEDKHPFTAPIPVTKEPRVAALLPRLRKRATDAITNGLYQTTALQWGVLPTVKDAVRVLSGTPSDSGRWRDFPVGDRSHTLSAVQQEFVEALRGRNTLRGTFPRGDKFDEPAFCHEALQMPAVRQSTALREGVVAIMYAAHSPRNIPDAARLLYDSDQGIRSAGVCLLRALVEHIPDKDTSGIPFEEYVKKEAALLRHWKKWWEAQPKPYKAAN